MERTLETGATPLQRPTEGAVAGPQSLEVAWERRSSSRKVVSPSLRPLYWGLDAGLPYPHTM
jgi:hypothetical protein